MSKRYGIKLECAYGEPDYVSVDRSENDRSVWFEIHQGRDNALLKLGQNAMLELVGFLMEVLADE